MQMPKMYEVAQVMKAGCKRPKAFQQLGKHITVCIETKIFFPSFLTT
jgi:hypothetical protein